MATTYFEKCPKCNHSYISHLDILRKKSGTCAKCKCSECPPRYYIYDKDPTFIKDALTLIHFHVTTHASIDDDMIEDIVIKIIDALNRTET